MRTTSPNPISRGRVFLSSPFSEPRGHLWPVRRQLYERLRSCGFEPWMWEEDGEKQKELSGKPDTTILLEAIQGSDLVVAFFKNRAGSYLPNEAFQTTAPEPFHASVFEICHARALAKPVHVYVVGHSYKASLASVLSIVADPLVLPEHARVVESEQALLDAVTGRLLGSIRPFEPARADLHDLDFDRIWLERELSGLTSAATFWAAKERAERIPLDLDLQLPEDTKRLYAQVLAVSAGVLANQAAYDRAIHAATLSVRCFLELGSWPEMFAQTQALSGILNMAGQPNAERVNRFGLVPAMRAYHNLQAAHFDSAGSILMRSGRWRSARKYLRRGVERNPNPYSLSKYGAALAASGATRDIDEAGHILYSEALPRARQTGESLGYTLRHAASLAIAQNEFQSAKALLHEAETECSRVGALHTLDRIHRLSSLVELLAPS